MDAIQDARDFLKDNGQDGTLRALDTALDILRASHHELKEALKEGFEQLCNPTLQGDKWRDFAANISEIISRAQLLKRPANAVQYKTDLHLSCELDSRIASGVVEDLSRTLNQAVKLLTTLLASAHRNERDYMPSEWHEAVDEAKEFIVMIKGNRDEPIGGV